MLTALGSPTGPRAQPSVPELVFESSPALAPRVAQLRRIGSDRLLQLMRFVGTREAGAPIFVLLADENTDLATRAPPWIAGYAIGERNLVVLFPRRSPSYPNSSLTEVLLHEVTHVLIARAAGYRPVPRWFNEGLAMIAEGQWGLGDRSRLGLAMLSDRDVSTTELGRRFDEGPVETRRAYAVAGALTNDLVRRHGPRAPAEILAALSRDLSFEDAFQSSTGISLREAERSFWQRYSLWYRWLPLVTSATTMWIGISLLAIVAIHRRRARDARLRGVWLEEERLEEERRWLTSIDDDPN